MNRVLRLSRYSQRLIVMILLSGLFAVFVIPPFQSPDETDHFKRIVQLGGGSAAVFTPPGETSGASLDKSVMRIIGPFLHLPHEKAARVGWDAFRTAYANGKISGELEHLSFPGSLSYAPWAYPGQVIGYGVAAIFSDNILLRFYASRLGSLLLAVMLIVLALHMVPAERWPRLSLILASAPFALFQFGAASPDGLLIAASLFVCAACVAVRDNSRGLAWMVLAALVLALVVASKPPMALFFVLIAAASLEARSKLRTKVLVLGSIALLLILTGLWFSYALPRIENLRAEGVSTQAQQSKTAAVLGDPLRYIGLGLKVFIERIWGYYSSLYAEMGWLDAPAPKPFIAVGRVLFLWALFGSLIPQAVRRFRSSSLRTRVVDSLPLGLAIAYVAGIMLALYLTWALPSPENMGAGVQGRYFFPVLALPLFALLRTQAQTLSWKIFFWVALINGPLALVVTLIRRYYLPHSA